ncbi:Lipid A biosynthesis lauroyl acyltransferase [Georgfuchsia toluolica]|uniref:Lipid A biosynthesis lauroyl acyltransferase n=1 Tax=Georgfuchsia toluolica TaxID=424218 RepID=A0A916N131_9PROT|nr:lysophospholipid acyltransferase family protein [Georgfuchsia toluolica]CAG4884498.1 Lipid A biosynthesis lauroyl acyltransferase [Georgfuchsia toluolica]
MELLFRLLGYLPLRVLHAFGTALGVVAYVLSERSRRYIRQNLAIAGLAQQVSPWRVMIEAGRTMMELPWLWLRPQQEIVAKVVTVSGWHHVDNALERKKGIVFFTPHLGCFEITAQYYAVKEPLTVMYRRPKQDWLMPLLEKGRGANFRLATADISGVRALMRTLRAREAIGILPDQVPGNGEGVWAPFFGKPAYTMTLAARLAASDTTVLLIYAERLPRGAGFHIKVRPFTELLTGTLQENAAAINRAIETLVRECPQQYAWNYNRYKVPAGAEPPP